MFRRFAKVPKPFSNCCCRVTTSADDTSGLKKLNVDDEDARVLFHASVAVVPVAKVPKPFSNCCCRVTTSADDTSGLKKLNVDDEDARVLFHASVAVVPVENPSVTLLLYATV